MVQIWPVEDIGEASWSPQSTKHKLILLAFILTIEALTPIIHPKLALSSITSDNLM